jgi:hypothetical protein
VLNKFILVGAHILVAALTSGGLKATLRLKKTAPSNRERMQVTGVIVNSLIATLKMKKVKSR